jgi:hypothetical protein
MNKRIQQVDDSERQRLSAWIQSHPRGFLVNTTYGTD